jgi:isoquinoline 1-oxidoreductase beta subunit
MSTTRSGTGEPNTVVPLSIAVNGVTHAVDAVDAERPLLWYLRDRLGLYGTKFGCGHGGCGACTVQIDGTAIPSCTVTMEHVAGKHVRTIEGLAREPELPVFRAWMAEQVPQCGYCQPAALLTAESLLQRVSVPTDDDIDAAFAHLLCRCGSYQRMRAAIHRAARRDWGGAPFAAASLPPRDSPLSGRRYRFNPWISITSDDIVVVTIERSEMGQGITTALAMLVAEELDVPLERVRTEAAPVNHAYDNPVIGAQITVGSMSVKNAWLRVRRAGAEARGRLIAVAARQWCVALETCHTQDGRVLDATGGRTATYGSLAEEAAASAPIEAPPLKERSRFTVLGRPQQRLEVPDHIAGRTIFGLDVVLPDMRYATMILPPTRGATVVSIDASAALAIPGVNDVITIDDGVAVVAADMWTAIRAHDAVAVTWTRGDDHLSAGSVRDALIAALDRAGAVGVDRGDALAIVDPASHVTAATYETPYAAHAPIEPINCTAWVRDGRCDVWVPTQGQSAAQAAAATAADLPRDAVRVHTTFLGGGFGRRSVPDVVTQAVGIAKRQRVPVQLVWQRSDDIQHDRYRPASAIRLRAACDAGGMPVALHMRIAGPKLAFDGVDLPYVIPNVRVENIDEDPGLPTGFWRSVGASQNAFALESFIDELAAAAHADPIGYRLALLPATSRHRAVLERVAEEAGWSHPPAGRSHGVAVYAAHGGWAAQIAEVSVDRDRILVHRVVCAVDCGFAINPDTVRAQIEGAIAFGITAALKAEITVESGRVVQTGFRDYPLLTLAEMPRVDVHIVESEEAPSGVGECGVPPIAPAIANAVYAATGRRLRRLPLRLTANA